MLKKIMKILLFTSILLFLQACSLKSRIKKADTAYELGEYTNAGKLYKRAYRAIPHKNKELRAKIAFKQAECYRLSNYFLAQQAYEKAIRNKYSDSVVYLRLAQILHRNGKYSKAVENYNLYLKSYPTSQLAQNGLKAMKTIAYFKENPTRFIVKKNKKFNANRSSTFSPVFIGSDDQTLSFTSSRRIGEKRKNILRKKNGVTGQSNNHLFTVRKNLAGKWEAVEAIEGEINSLNDEGVASFTANGRQMFFTRSLTAKDNGSGTVILSTSRSGGTWAEPHQITLFKDSTISVAHPAISSDGTTLYFVSDAPGGVGGKDIWRAKYDGTAWKYIENLGDTINTEGDEMFPTLRADGTLYFSSNGHPGYGGLDLFVVEKNEKNQTVVTNMGKPINSSFDDFGICFQTNADKGFFSTNRKSTRAYDALWEFELPLLEYLVEGKITDRTGNPIPDAKIKIVGNNGENIRIQAKGNGYYKYKMRKGSKYAMLALARGYLNQKKTISAEVVDDRKSEKHNIDFHLTPISKPVKMENIFYEFAKWNLTAESEEGLEELVKLLNDNPNITIELGAHTDYVGNNATNKKLSMKRAESVVDYLIKKGIAKDRLTAIGYGEEIPVTVDLNTAKKYDFLPVNTQLTEEFIKTLSEDQQEQANQINRRTEFRVLKTTYNLY